MRLVARWLALCGLGLAASTASATTFTFRTTSEGPAEGLNDATPFTPEGGNNATTLGQARLNVLNEAARIWGTLINSTVDIIVDASADPLACTLNSATLAQARTTFNYRDFPGAPRPNVFYPSALADALTGVNVSEQGVSSANGSADLQVSINSTLQNTPGCFGGLRFYYGFDHNNGQLPDLLQVLLHEFAHGFGFSTRVNLDSTSPDFGKGAVGTSDNIERFNSYDQFIIDETLNTPWISLTAAQRQQSAARTGSLAWTGDNANKWRTHFSAGVTANNRFQLYAPATITPGSSVSHFDTALTPYVLMEPFRMNTTSSATDLTPCILKDIGWSVTRCIDGINATPVATPQTITVLEDTPITITLGGVDADNDALTYTLGSSTPTRGTLSALSSPATPTTLFSPTLNANGADSFTFTVSDDSSTSVAGTVTVNITPVNDAPVAVPKSATTPSGQPVAIALTGSDVDGDALTFTVVSNPASGTVTGTPPNVSYTSNSGFTGSDSFTYRANDASLASAPVTVTVTVTAAPAQPSSGGGGGGVTGLPFLALLAGLLAHARRRAARAAVAGRSVRN